MATQRSSFAKLQRDRDKKAKQAAKRERRQERGSERPAEDDDVLAPLLDDSGAELTPAQLLELVERVHQQFEAKEIDYETFEETKAQLLARLPVD